MVTRVTGRSLFIRREIHMRIAFTVLVVALVAACASSEARDRTPGLALDIQPTPSAAGAEVSLVLRNGSSAQLGYNLCTARLSQLRGDHWLVIDSRPNCTEEQQTLQPGAEASYDVTLPAGLGGGSYRYSLRTQVGDSRIEEIYSRSFNLPEPPPAEAATDGES
jgi:hypothetical protein